MQDTLGDASREVLFNVGRALFIEGQKIMTKSKREVPVDDGPLKSSGFVEKPKRTFRAVTVTLGYGGAAKAYALAVHEYPEGKRFHIKGFGRETRSYCYIDDAMDAILKSVEKLGNNSVVGPMNIGNEGRITILDLAREIVAVSSKDIEIQLTPGETAVWGQSVDCSEARLLLDGWRPKVSLKEGLQQTYDDVIARLQEIYGAV